MRYPSPIRHVKSCKYCTDYEGDPKPIMPENQHLAKRMPSGDYMCFQCQTENMIKMMNREMYDGKKKMSNSKTIFQLQRIVVRNK